eukprot:scaffold252109_cov11-Tisochrysis_lutea.AAC.1
MAALTASLQLQRQQHNHKYLVQLIPLGRQHPCCYIGGLTACSERQETQLHVDRVVVWFVSPTAATNAALLFRLVRASAARGLRCVAKVLTMATQTAIPCFMLSDPKCK